MSGESKSGESKSGESQKPSWEERMSEAGNRIEDEVRRVIRYLNDEVVPEVRRNGSDALRSAAAEIERLADSMDRRRASAPPPHPPRDVPKP